MKKTFGILVSFILMLCMLCGCGTDVVQNDLWENALYNEDTELGTGGKAIILEVVAEDKSVAFTIKTDKDNLEDALTEHGLISGEKGPYGMYVKFVNGIEADYDKTKAYWSLSKNGEYMTTGVGDTVIDDGEKYEFTYMK